MFAAFTTTTSPEQVGFFSAREVERIISFEHLTIPMFLTLDNMDFLDEKMLIDLGGILSAMHES